MTPAMSYVASRRSLAAAALLLPLLFAVTAAVGCSSSDPVGPKPPAELRTAPLQAVIGGQTLALDAYLWRDFQPTSPPDGKPLAVVVHVRPANGSPLTAAVSVDAVWVINGANVWAANAREIPLADAPPPFYEAAASGGPKWGPGVTVDVVARVIDRTSGRSQLLRVTEQKIGRTE